MSPTPSASTPTDAFDTWLPVALADPTGHGYGDARSAIFDAVHADRNGPIAQHLLAQCEHPTPEVRQRVLQLFTDLCSGKDDWDAAADNALPRLHDPDPQVHREDLVAKIKAANIRVCTATSPNWRAFAERVGHERAEELFASMRWMAHLDVPMIAGTDAGVTRAVFDKIANSLEFYQYLGIPLAKIIDIATINAAQALGIGSDTGRLAEGLRADILVVDGNPLADLDALRRVQLVLAAGLSAQLDV